MQFDQSATTPEHTNAPLSDISPAIANTQRGAPPPAPKATPTTHTGFQKLDYLLFTVTVFSWSASWYAISLQPGIVANEVSLIDLRPEKSSNLW